MTGTGVRRYGKKLQAVADAELDLVEAGHLDARLLRLTHDEKFQVIQRVREKRKQLALDNFFYFSKHVYGNSDMSTMHGELSEFVTGEGNRKLILEPRGTFKSTVVTESYVLWRLLHNPNLRILIDNEEYSKAKAFLRAIRDCIEYNEEFRRLFGKLDSNKYNDTWTEAAFNISTRTERRREANLSCAGLDSTKTGLHYDLIVCDDLVSDKNTKTDGQLKKTIEHYRLLLSLLDPGKEIIVIGTRWHFADLYGYLLESDERRKERDQRPLWRKLIRSAIKPDGTLLFPERLTEEFLQEQRFEQGPYIFSCQYMNDPTGGEDAIFKKGWLRFFEELPQVPMEFSVVLDPAVGRSKKSDYSAITIRATSADKRRYFVRVMRGRWNPTKTILMLSHAWQWTKDTYGQEPRVGMETIAFQWVLAHNAKEMMRAGRIPTFKIHELRRTTETTKHYQIEQLVPIFEAGLVHFRGKSVDKCSPGAKLAIEEYLQFPHGKYDDILDTISYHEELARIPRIPQSERKTDTLLQKVLNDAKRRGRARSLSSIASVGSRISGKTRGDDWWRRGVQ